MLFVMLLVLQVGASITTSTTATSTSTSTSTRQQVPACNTIEDCNRAGECTAIPGNQKTCICDDGWTGNYCQYLDLAPLKSPQAGGAWNSRTSANSSWCIHPFASSSSSSSKYHIFVSEMPPGCGLNSWLPGKVDW